MDKLGPICRSIGDCALAFDAIRGPDPEDDSTVDAPFTDLGPVSVKGWRVGHVKGDWRDPKVEEKRLAEVRALGCELVEIEMPKYPLGDLFVILTAEAAAAFDEFTRTGVERKMARQEEQAWPNVFRASRLIPAVEYIRANRVRRLLMRDTSKLFEKCDVIVHPTMDDGWQILENLTGNPTVCAPTELGAKGTPGSVSFTAQCFDESRALAIAEAWQRATGYNAQHPPLQ
jgi:Asp-tRNA(Asn)/Glu-tRNA(Gln) amidotransferase A subunit family amidase